MILLINFYLSLLHLFISGDDKPVYKIFKSDNKISNYSDLLINAKNADVILFGELHDNPISHWLQLELTKDLQAASKKLIVGAEMFEADEQQILTEYINGIISERSFKEEMKLWSNYKTDYKPIVDYCKQNKIPFIATNVPRRYASIVYQRGIESLDTLTETAKQFIAPLPIKYDGNLNCYKEIFQAAGGHGGENLPKSQAIKDATMAYFIAKNLKAENLFLHFNGAYHSNNHEAIAWYLLQENPQLKIFVISSVEQEKLDKLEPGNQKLGDYIICTPLTLTKTH